EYDVGHNAFSSGNLFSGPGPADEFVTGLPAPTSFATYDKLTQAIQNNGGSDQIGWAFMGHVQIPNTAFTVLGLFQQWLPNSKASVNPNDFQRFVVGLEYKWNKYLRFALDSQNLLYYHDQFAFR